MRDRKCTLAVCAENIIFVAGYLTKKIVAKPYGENRDNFAVNVENRDISITMVTGYTV